MTGQEIPPLRERLRRVRFTRAAMWSDAELVCILLAEQASAVETAMQRLAGRCCRNAKAAQRPAPAAPMVDGRGEAEGDDDA